MISNEKNKIPYYVEVTDGKEYNVHTGPFLL